MSSTLRNFEPGARVVLTTKTVEAKFLMSPDVPKINDKVAGIVGRAQRKHLVIIHGLVFMSNHFHIHATGRDPQQIADFMRDVKSWTARELNGIRGRSGVFWAHRYKLQESTGEDEADIDQLAYVLAHAAKEGLVAEPTDWTGVSSARELLGDGAVTAGTWIDQTAIARTTPAKAEREAASYRHRHVIELTPLPCLAECDDATRRARLREAVDEVICAEREKNGITREVRRRTPRLPHWDLRPADLAESAVAQRIRKERDETRKARDAAIRSATKEAREELAELRKRIAGVHAEASQAFRARRPAYFPAFTFPPGLPMVGAAGLYVPGSRRGGSAAGGKLARRQRRLLSPPPPM